MGLRVLLFIPNIIGYIRFLLVLISWCGFDYPAVFVPCYVIAIILDGVDGWVARQLDQKSEFGAWLDVVVDNLGRGMLWSMQYEWGWLVSALEWCVFVCNHNRHGAQWKDSFVQSPRLIQAIMAKDFKTPVGFFAIAGLHVLPVWLYGWQKEVLSWPLCVPIWLQIIGVLLLAAGRLLCLCVEVWCLWCHISFLTRDEQVKRE
ncbi:hypothetical protein GJAV_G00061350 [Gymnothorax javanicus]|nr:hypothetical protein GJAV_G00061350 [Gymnothorax javanicus]